MIHFLWKQYSIMHLLWRNICAWEGTCVFYINNLVILIVQHRCHSEENCPPCTVLTEKWCMGNHEVCSLSSSLSFSMSPVYLFLWTKDSRKLSVVVVVNFHSFFLFSRTTWPISTKLGTKHPWVKGIHVSSIIVLCLPETEDNYKKCQVIEH